MGRLDIHELLEYSAKVGKTKRELNDFLRKFMYEMASRVLAKVKPRTPVQTGALRRSWRLGEVKGYGNTVSVEIKNPMEYATEIEYGRRIVVGGNEVGWQNGRFMLKLSVDEIVRQMPARFASEFSAWIGGRL